MAQVIQPAFYDWSNVSVTLAGLSTKLDGLISINYGESVDTAEVRGLGNKVRGYTSGQRTVKDVTMELSYDSYENFVNTFGYEELMNGTATFEITISCVKAGADPISVTLRGCKVIDIDVPFAVGSDPINATVVMKVLEIIRG